jgi:hypothetical protein
MAYRQENVKNAADDSVVNVSKKLYPFLPDNDIRSDTTTESYLKASKEMVAVICREILAACSDVQDYHCIQEHSTSIHHRDRRPRKNSTPPGG